MIENECYFRYGKGTYLVLTISMHDVDFAEVHSYGVASEKLSEHFKRSHYKGNAQDIDENIFHYVPDKVLNTKNADKIVKEISDSSGIELTDYKGEEDD